MKKSLYLFLIIFFGIYFSAEGQILKKIGKAVKQATEEVLEEKILGTEEVVKTKEPEAQGPVGSSIEKNRGISKKGTVGGTALKNAFENHTTSEFFGEVGTFVEVSPDRRFIAHSGLQGTRPVMFINGKPGPEFDDVPKGLRFSEYGGHYAYTGKRGGKCFVVIDGKESEPLDCELVPSGRSEFHFNKDGSLLYYFTNTRKFGERKIVINGELGPVVPITSRPNIAGKNVYYMGVAGIPYKNLQPLEGLPPIKKSKHGYDIQVTPDGEQFLYVTGQSRELSVVWNGEKIAGPFSLLDAATLDPSGAVQYTYRMEDSQNHSISESTGVILWKGQIYKTPPGEDFINNFLVSSDGKQYAYFTEGQGGQRAWWNGNPGQYYEKISEAQFSADGQKFGYLAQAGGKNFLVMNGKEYGPFNSLTNFEFSEKGSAFTFIGKQGTEENRYFNGIEKKLPLKVGGFNFSPDGKRYAYAHEKTIVVDGEVLKYPGMEFLSTFEREPGTEMQYFIFGPQGKRLAYSFTWYTEEKQTELVMVLDDEIFRSSWPNKKPFGYPTFSPGGTHFAFLSPERGEGNDLNWRLIVNMKPGPIIGDHGRKLGNPGDVNLYFQDENTLKVQGYMDGKIVAHTITL
jgi:hypothetical protein